jgi:hypothetical protein
LPTRVAANGAAVCLRREIAALPMRARSKPAPSGRGADPFPSSAGEVGTGSAIGPTKGIGNSTRANVVALSGRIEERTGAISAGIEHFQRLAAQFGSALLALRSEVAEERPIQDRIGLRRPLAPFLPRKERAGRRHSGSRIERFQWLAAPFGSVLLRPRSKVGEEPPIRDRVGLRRWLAPFSLARNEPTGAIPAPESSVSNGLRRHSVPFSCARGARSARNRQSGIASVSVAGTPPFSLAGNEPTGAIPAPESRVASGLRHGSVPLAPPPKPWRRPSSRTIPTARSTVARFVSHIAP